MKQTATTSSTLALVGPSSSHHVHSSVPLNLTLKNVMHSVNRSTPAPDVQTSNANIQSGDIHCTNTTAPGSSNGKQHSLFRKPVHILPPTHSSIRNLAYHQLTNKNSHNNAAAFNANGALQSKQ